MNKETTIRSISGIQIIEINGRFDAHQVPAVQTVIENEMAQGANHLLVNLAGVNFIDTRALSLLVTGMKRCRQNEGDLRVCSLQQPVHIIFELTGLGRAFQIFEDEATAVASFTPIAAS